MKSFVLFSRYVTPKCFVTESTRVWFLFGMTALLMILQGGKTDENLVAIFTWVRSVFSCVDLFVLHFALFGKETLWATRASVRPVSIRAKVGYPLLINDKRLATMFTFE